MSNYRTLLIKYKVHLIINPFSKLLLKVGNFARLASWIHQNRTLAYNDFYTPGNNYSYRYNLYQFLIENEIHQQSVNYLEFGVGDGETIKWWTTNIKHSEALFAGFDTFEGLPEDWGIFKKI